MKISTKGRYALRLMLDLALNDSEKPTRIKEISERQGISDKYLEQIIAVLNKARYVRSIRGPQGGYLLTKKPEEYTVGMILRLTEGSMAPVDCVDEELGSCSRMDNCATVIVWKTEAYFSTSFGIYHEEIEGEGYDNLLSWLDIDLSGTTTVFGNDLNNMYFPSPDKFYLAYVDPYTYESFFITVTRSDTPVETDKQIITLAYDESDYRSGHADALSNGFDQRRKE